MRRRDGRRYQPRAPGALGLGERASACVFAQACVRGGAAGSQLRARCASGRPWFPPGFPPLSPLSSSPPSRSPRPATPLAAAPADENTSPAGLSRSTNVRVEGPAAGHHPRVIGRLAGPAPGPAMRPEAGQRSSPKRTSWRPPRKSPPRIESAARELGASRRRLALAAIGAAARSPASARWDRDVARPRQALSRYAGRPRRVPMRKPGRGEHPDIPLRPRAIRAR